MIGARGYGVKSSGQRNRLEFPGRTGSPARGQVREGLLGVDNPRRSRFSLNQGMSADDGQPVVVAGAVGSQVHLGQEGCRGHVCRPRDNGRGVDFGTTSHRFRYPNFRALVRVAIGTSGAAETTTGAGRLVQKPPPVGSPTPLTARPVREHTAPRRMHGPFWWPSGTTPMGGRPARFTMDGS